MTNIIKPCHVCKATGKYGRTRSPKANPQVCWMCHGEGELKYPHVE